MGIRVIMKVLGIYGSPRAGGNTDLLLDSFLSGCGEKGADVHRLYLRDLDFGPCVECGGCSASAVCVLEDGMTPLYPLLGESDGIVLASPIFFYGVTALAKAFIDRMQPFHVEKYVLKREPHTPKERKRGFFISAGATGGGKLFDGAVLTVKYFFDSLSADYTGAILHRHVEGRGAIAGVEGALAGACEAGRRFASPPAGGEG